MKLGIFALQMNRIEKTVVLKCIFGCVVLWLVCRSYAKSFSKAHSNQHRTIWRTSTYKWFSTWFSAPQSIGVTWLVSTTQHIISIYTFEMAIVWRYYREQCHHCRNNNSNSTSSTFPLKLSDTWETPCKCDQILVCSHQLNIRFESGWHL